MKKTILIVVIILATTGLFGDFRKHPENQISCENRKINNKREFHKKSFEERKHDFYDKACYSQLNLNEKQKKQIDDLLEKHQLNEIDSKAELEKLRIRKRTAMKNNNTKEAYNLIDKISLKNAEKQKARLKLKNDINNLLNTEQKKQLKELNKNK